MWRTVFAWAVVATSACVAAYNYVAISSAFSTAQGYYEARQLSTQVMESLFREESSLRGFTSTRDTLYLQTYGKAHDQYELRFSQLQRFLARVRVRGTTPYVLDLQRIHDQWTATIARPLMASPSGDDAQARQRIGELFFSTMGDDTAALNETLEGNVAAASADVRYSIYSAIVQIAALTLVFGFGVIMLRQTNRRLERRYVADITDANKTLVNAQRLAGVGSWTEELATGAIVWSDELFRIFASDGAMPPPGALRGFDHPEDAPIIHDALEEFERTGKPYRIDHRIVLHDGRVRYVQEQAEYTYDADGARAGIIGTLLDVTERKSAEARLTYLAHHDALTGLPNRTMLAERLSHSLAYAQRQRRYVAVLFLDLDRFKVINDTLGHAVGDQLLIAAGTRLRNAVRSTDTVARSGGDEFILVLGDIAGPGDLIVAANAIMEAFARPFSIHGHELFVTSSVGVSVYPRDGMEVDTLIKHADAALYQAKDQGRNNLQYYTADLHETAVRKMSLENEMRRSLERGQFVVHYHPLVDLRTHEVTGFEALLRWQHPTLGLLQPGEFISVAEESGFIVPLGEWALRTACMQQKRWEEMGFGERRVTVNLSARQFQQSDLAAAIERILADTGARPGALEIELTESLLMKDADGGLAVLHRLKNMGLGLSVDDFGTGYSSLGYLKNFPIDALKIDRSFVRDITTDRFDAAICSAIVSLARSLNLQVIAEGVETQEQLAMLQRLGCDVAQGYLFGKPLPADQCAELMTKAQPWSDACAQTA